MTAPEPLIPPRPVPPAFPLRRFLRRNLLLTLSTAIFAAVTVLVLVQVDRVYYGQAKAAILQEDREFNEYISGEVLENIVTKSLAIPSREDGGTPVAADPRKLAELDADIAAYMDSLPMVLSLRLYGGANDVLVETERPGRMRTQNDFTNCLLIRSWEKRLTKQKNKEVSGSRRSAVIVYTTPRGHAGVERLTRQWRWIAAGIAVAILAVYGLLVWGVILPTRSVMSALDKGARVGSPFLERPRSLLEKYYNNLARDATLSIFSTHLRSYAARESGLEVEPIVDVAPRLVSELFPIAACGALLFRRREKDGPWTLDRTHSRTDGLPEELAARVIAAIGRDDAAEVDGLYSREIWESPLMRAAFVARRTDWMASNAAWWDDVLEGIAREIGFALRIAAERRRVIFQEKSKANISLSRNLGHDLTNIIATSKLELMTLKSLLEMKSEDIYKSEQKRRLFRESLESVLSSTRFLQETVNLYRSFTYLSRPKFERILLSELVAEAGGLFKLSISRNIGIRMELDESLPPITVEPRLLKLAIFNLLSNAADAIKLGATVEKPRGEIEIRTSAGQRPGHQEVTVLDSGMGIRGPGGDLLGPGEIEQVFRLGYTTKEQGTGEGLGLNWVSQIVRDFHAGELIAANRPEGGASFGIVLSAHAIEELAEAAREADSGAIRKPGGNG